MQMVNRLHPPGVKGDTPERRYLDSQDLTRSALWPQITPPQNLKNISAATDRSKYSIQRKSSMGKSNQPSIFSKIPLTDSPTDSPSPFNQQSRRLRIEKQELSVKCNMLMNRLRQLAPQSDDSIFQLVQHTDARIRQLQQQMRVKKDKIMGYYKVKVATLLERYGFRPNELNFHKIHTEAELIELLIDKFSQKDKEIEQLWLQRQEQMDKMKLLVARHQQDTSRANHELTCLKQALEKYQHQLDEANAQVTSMGRMLNSRRIEQSMKIERQRIQLDRDQLNDDFMKTRSNLSEMEKYYSQQLAILDRRNRQLQSRLAYQSKQLVDEKIKLKETELRADQMKTEVEKLRMHLKIQRQNAQRQNRQATRWKQRFEQLDSSNRPPEVYRSPIIEYKKAPMSDGKNKSLTTVEASALYDRKSIARDQKALSMFLDKEIKKLESDLTSKGKLAVSPQH